VSLNVSRKCIKHAVGVVTENSVKSHANAIIENMILLHIPTEGEAIESMEKGH
jgi:hypothetical protein